MFETPFLPFVIAISFMGGAFIFFMAMLFVKIKKRQNIRNKKQLQELLDEKENTMHSIAMELHDNVNQVLHMIRMDMHVIEENVTPSYRSLAENIGDRLDGLLFDTQNISHYLNPQYVKHIGFIPALQEATNWLNSTGCIRCRLNIEGERKILPHQTGLMAFRIAQEAMRNVLQYAQATNLSIILTFKDRDFQMRLVDNGKGMTEEDMNKGSGMDNIRKRANIIGGVLTIHSIPGTGTTVLLDVPNFAQASTVAMNTLPKVSS